MNHCFRLLTLGFVSFFVPELVNAQDTASSNARDAWVYDPIKGTSEKANDPITAAENHWYKASPGTFTFECFAKPADALETMPRDFLPVFVAKLGESGSAAVGIHRNKPPHSYNWWEARIQVDAKSKPIVLSRRKYNGISMVRGSSPYRHVAFTWDAETKTAAFYLDYRFQSEAVVENLSMPEQLHFDLGHGADDDAFKPFQGNMLGFRLSHEPLKPHEFQRLTTLPLEGVSFAAESQPSLPSDYGHVDVRLHYGAVGDGVHDDTEAIRRAFRENQNRVPNDYRTVYFPAGTYRITDTIQFSRFMVVRGAGRERTTIKLDNDAAGYDDVEVPKAVFAVGYDWPYVGRTKRQRAGNVIGNYVFDLSIDSGNNNPAALGLDFHCNNHGAVENVAITSGDGSGHVGLDFKRGWPGPCLIKNVSIDGFDVGIDAAHREYSLVFSGVELRNQREVAIRNRGNTLSMENVVSENSVPAIESNGGGLVVLLNSRLSGGSESATAIASENASLYLRNVESDGYGVTYEDRRVPKDAAAETLATSSDKRVDEYFTGPFDNSFEARKSGSLKLPIKQTPSMPRPPIADWVNVRDFESLVINGDWAPAIQAAIDSGKRLVYFPATANYRIDNDVVVRGNVETLFGGSPKVGVSNGWDGKKNTEDVNHGPAFRIASSVKQLQIEMMHVARLIHDTPATLVFRHGRADEIDASAGCGNIFAEDTEGKWRVGKHQRVWGRQLNPETKGIPEIVNDGGQFWVLGLKTEYLSTKIVNRNSASTELLGGLMYPVHPVVDESLPMFVNEEANISLIHSVSVYKKNHKIYIRDTQRGDTVENANWHWVSGRPLTNLYRSDRSLSD